jgi:hypothetical protein
MAVISVFFSDDGNRRADICCEGESFSIEYVENGRIMDVRVDLDNHTLDDIENLADDWVRYIVK